MLRIVLAQIRRRVGRATALLLGVFVATTGFAVLTGSTATSRLQVIGSVQQNFRSAYDILVRPAADRTPLEEQRDLVRPNFLSGQFGGITMDQYQRVRQLTGVEVAAPIAMIGYASALGSVQVDVTDAVDRTLVRQLVRVNPTWRSAGGLTVVDDASPHYAYVTQRPVIWPVLGDRWDYEYSDGRVRPELKDACDGTIFPLEIQEDGRELPLCQVDPQGWAGPLGADTEQRPMLTVARLRPDGQFAKYYREQREVASERLVVGLEWPLSLLLAAIDPAAEADLVGLDAAVTSGSYVSAQDRSVPISPFALKLPVITTTSPFLDERLTTTVEHLAGPSADRLAGQDWRDAWPGLQGTTGTTVAGTGDYSAADAYRNALDQAQLRDGAIAMIFPIVRSGDPTYDVGADGILTPQRVAIDPTVFTDERVQGVMWTSWLAADGGFRPLDKFVRDDDQSTFSVAVSIGTFDPRKLRGFSELSAVPLETYLPPRATGADAASRDLLHGQPLQPDSNPAGYLATPPMMLTSLTALPGLVDSPAPLSAIRVRVAGVTGFDATSRERVRTVAEAIASATGLDVDITMGSSPAPQTVNLPAGQFGRPELRLTEEWTKKGVATVILQAIDRKSVVLFGLILVVCVLFLGNAVSAAVRDRRRDLAVLACLGWSRARLAGLIATEVGLVGLAAGIASAAVAMPLARAVGVQFTPLRALVAIPVALVLALLAALVPALRAARTHPAPALQAAARSPRRGRRHRTVVGLAVANLWRVPGRTLLGALALGIGICAATVLSAVTWAFHGSVTGTLLGDAVSLRVRGVDTVAVAAIILLGVAAVADVLYLNVRDRSSELAALSATGWSAAAVGRLVSYEAIGIGLIGATVGAALGLVGAARFAGGFPIGLGWAAAGAVGAGLLLTGVAAQVPVLLARRIPMSTLLAEE
jgi:putative ABC transport system permease protein